MARTREFDSSPPPRLTIRIPSLPASSALPSLLYLSLPSVVSLPIPLPQESTHKPSDPSLTHVESLRFVLDQPSSLHSTTTLFSSSPSSSLPTTPHFIPPAEEQALANYFKSHRIPWTANPGVIVASILVSILGSYATLMLLGRRTSVKGLKNFVWLVLAAMTFSVVGIWSMHFVRSRPFQPSRAPRLRLELRRSSFASFFFVPSHQCQVSMLGIRLQPSDDYQWYIRFTPGFTVLSLFVPLLCCSLAFVFLGSQSELVVWRVCMTGVVVGGTISLMHVSRSDIVDCFRSGVLSASFRLNSNSLSSTYPQYSAAFRLPTFQVHYSAYTIVLAILEACVASTVALLLFFKYRALCQSTGSQNALVPGPPLGLIPLSLPPSVF